MINSSLTLSSRKNHSGKCEILVRCDISRTNRPRFKSGVFVSPETFVSNDNLYAPSKKYEKEVKTSQNAIDDFVDKLDNIISVATDAVSRGRFHGELDKDWILEALSHKESIDLNNCSYRELNELITEERLRREAEEQAAKEAEERASRKTIFEYICEYPIINNLSEKRSDLFLSLARSLMRFQMYKQRLVKGQAQYIIDIDTWNNDDIIDLRRYLREESALSQKYHIVFDKICSQVDESLPVRKNNSLEYQKKIKERGINHVEGMLSKLHTVIRSLISRKITNNDPFVGLKLQKTLYADPVCLTKEERNLIASIELDKRLSWHRDIFVFQCFTGCRYEDMANLRKDNVDVEEEESWLCYIPSKTMNHNEDGSPVECNIQLQPTALEIIKKHSDPESELLLNVPKMTAFNDSIKKILSLCGITRKVEQLDGNQKKIYVPINEISSSHLARRTFINLLYNEIQDPNLIGKMSGHVEGSKAFSRYRKIDRKLLANASKKLN